MTNSGFTESAVEEAVLAGLESVGRAIKHRPVVRGGECFETNGPRSNRPGGPKAAVSAKNASTQKEGNMQKMYIALKRQN